MTEDACINYKNIPEITRRRKNVGVLMILRIGQFNCTVYGPFHIHCIYSEFLCRYDRQSLYSWTASHLTQLCLEIPD